MTTILAAIDDSAAAKPVLDTAMALAPALGAKVEAVHVGDVAGQTTQACAQAVNVPLHTISGDPLEEIVRMAALDEVVAVVLGARGRPTGRRPAGHLALGVADTIAKPVVVVPPEARPPAVITNVLVAMAGTPGNARNLQRAIALAAAVDLELVVVHVDDEDTIPSFCDQVQYETEAYAKEFLARYAPGAPISRLILRVGVPADEVLATVDDIGPHLLAVGWRQHDDPSRGSVAREIVNRSSVPVLLVALASAGG